MELDFGRLTGMVRKVNWTPLYARVRIAGGPGSGKTFGALQMAMGLRRPGGVIVLANCGEAQGEMHYAGMTDFYNVQVAEVAAAMAKDANWRHRADEGTDPRAIAATVEELAHSAPPGSVIIVDSASDGWDATKALADVIKGGDDRRQGIAWQEAGGYWSGLMETFDSAPAHLIVCVRAKTEPEVVKGRDGYTFHAPTSLDMRGRDAHRQDLRFTIDSMHRVWSCEGRIDAFNQHGPKYLDEAFGRRLAGYLATGHDPGNAAVDVASLPLPGTLYGPQAPAPNGASGDEKAPPRAEGGQPQRQGAGRPRQARTTPSRPEQPVPLPGRQKRSLTWEEADRLCGDAGVKLGMVDRWLQWVGFEWSLGDAHMEFTRGMWTTVVQQCAPFRAAIAKVEAGKGDSAPLDGLYHLQAALNESSPGNSTIERLGGENGPGLYRAVKDAVALLMDDLPGDGPKTGNGQ